MRNRFAILAALLCTAAPAAAQENGDLDLIPGTIGADNQPAAAPQPPSHGKYFVEDAMGWFSYRGSFAVPYPYGLPSRWSDRLSIDGLDHWDLNKDLTLTLSDRLSASFAEGVGFPNESVRNDLREVYLTWEVAPETYLEAGRINVKNGVALGYNPTDYFRARTTVAQSSADPGAARNNRLGTAMVRAQRIFDGGAVEIIYAPKLHKQVPLNSGAGPFDPKFDQTNGTNRFLASFSFELEEFSPQILVFHDSGNTKFGLNFSHPIGASVIAYASWSGGIARNAFAEAIAFGRQTGTFPSVMPTPAFVDTSKSFKNDLSIGGSWTGEDKITLSAEYNFHEAGFSKSDWRTWFDAGADPAYSSLMWYVRGYSSDRQQPASQHQAFLRADWAEPFHIQHFDINGFVMTGLSDGSMLGQLASSYDLSDNWSVSGYVGWSIGARRSEWGSTRSAASVILQVARYL